MSLRRRLLLSGLIVVLALAVADLIVAVTVRSYLFGRVDRQLEPGVTAMARSPLDPGAFVRQAGASQRKEFFDDYYVDVRDSTGTVIFQTPRDGDHQRPAPRLDAAQVVARAGTAGRPPAPYTVGSVEGGASWRVVSVRLLQDQGIVVAALSLAETEATIKQVITIEIAATVGVLLVLAVVAFWMLRLGIRPLEDVTVTAGAIAGGDLSPRVGHTNPRTEVGRLGAAFNAMLHRIEEAFQQRAEGEERLRRFVADASHELRTPLTSIQGYTDLYHQGALRDGPQLGEAMRRMGSEANRMGLLVDDLLLLARLDQGRIRERAAVRLDLLAADAVADAQAVENDRPIQLQAPPGGVTIEGDEPRLRQVAANLLANARLHTPAGTPVQVRVSESGGWATLEVADQGPGMTAQEAQRVFERFYRVDSGRSRARGGTGLGLAIVAAVAESHGGRVEVDTSPGRGARFQVHLPVTGPTAKDEAQTAP